MGHLSWTCCVATVVAATACAADPDADSGGGARSGPSDASGAAATREPGVSSAGGASTPGMPAALDASAASSTSPTRDAGSASSTSPTRDAGPASTDRAPGAGVPAPPTPANLPGAKGERGACGLPEPGAMRQSFGECHVRTLPGTNHTYCVKANPACATAGANCFVVITFNMGATHGLSLTYAGRVDQPQQFGRFIAVGGGTEATNDVMAELPRQLQKDYPGVDPARIYALGNSRGTGAISAITSANTSRFGTTWAEYAAIALVSGGMRVGATFKPAGRLHAIFINGWNDVAEPGGARALATLAGCAEPQAAWRNVAPTDPLMAGGDGTDIAQRLTFGACSGGDVVAYRFKDEGHVADFDKHFDPRVRAVNIAWDFFQGRTRDSRSIAGPGSACFRE